MKVLLPILGFLLSSTLAFSQNDWTKIKQKPTQGAPTSQMAKEDDHILLGTQTGILRSIDNGQTWKKVNDNLAFFSGDQGGVIELSGDTAWAHDGSKNVYSFDGGRSWNTLSGPADSLAKGYYSQHEQFVEGLRFYKSYAGQREEFLFYTDDFGQTWHQDTSYERDDFMHINLNHEWLFRYNATDNRLSFTKDGNQFHQLPSLPVSLGFEGSLEGDTSDLYLGNRTQILKYNSTSQTWNAINTNVPGDGNDFLVNAKGDTVVILRQFASNASIQGFISTNAGDDWQSFEVAEFGYPMFTVLFDNSTIWAPTIKGLYKSEDLGTSWSNASGELYSRAFVPQSLDEKLMVSSYFDLFEYTPSQQNFSKFELGDSLAPNSYYEIKHSPKALYLRNDRLFGSSNRQLLYKKSGGNGWKKVSSPGGVLSSQFYIHNQFIATSTQSGGFYFSDDYGQNWDSLNFSFDIFTLSGVTVYNNRVVLALEKQVSGRMNEQAFYSSEDNGTNWKPFQNTSPELLQRMNITELVGLDDGFVVISGSYPEVDSTYLYNGNGWTSHSIENVEIHQPVRQVRKKNGSIYLLNDSAIFVSEDKGRSWEVEQILPEPGKALAYSIAFGDEYLMVGTNEGLYQTLGYSSSVKDHSKTTHSKFGLFPNPVSGNQVRLKYTNSRSFDFNTLQGAVYNNQGQPVARFRWDLDKDSNQKTIDLPDGLKQGIYHIKLQGKGETYSKSFVKE